MAAANPSTSSVICHLTHSSQSQSIFEFSFYISFSNTSLGEVLNHYPTLAGRMETETALRRIRLNNHGAAFRVQSTPQSSIHEILLHNQEQEPPIGLYCYIPVPGEQVEGMAPLLTVTLTQFQN
jgi:hypothetical protein